MSQGKYRRPSGGQSSQRDDVVRVIKQAIQSEENRVNVVNQTIRVSIPPKFIGDELTAATKFFDDHGYKYINE